MRTKHYFRSLILLLIAFFFTLKVNAQYTRDSLYNELQQIMDNDMSTFGFKGAGLAVILPDGSEWETVSGNIQPGMPVSLSRPWHMGSNLMPMMTALALRLQDSGQLNINDPISMYIDLDTVPYQDSADGITIKNLLNHTSPITNSWCDTCAFKNAVYSNNCTVWNRSQFFDSAYWYPNTPNPNQEYRFNSLNNYILLECILENITGNTVEFELDNRFFTPLGMDSSYLANQGINIQNLNGYWLGSQNGFNWCMKGYMSTRRGSSGLISTPLETSRFMRAFYNNTLVNNSLMNEVSINSNTDNFIPGTCLGDLDISYGLGTSIVKASNPGSSDTLTFYGHWGSGLNRVFTYHNVDSNITVSFIQNDIIDILEPATYGALLNQICHILNKLSILQLHPTADFSFTNSDQTFTFSDASTNYATSWIWDFGDGNIDTVQNPVHTYSSGGTYNVMLIATNAGGSDTIIKSIVVPTINGFQNAIVHGVKVFPNPFNEILTFDFKINNIMPHKIEIYNLQGTLVDELYPDKNETKVEWDASRIESGIFIYRMNNSNQVLNGRIIKQ